ncbi:MAG: MTH938/NDUFAF3 family protein, partial [Xanthobacteraceae bacterium]
MDDRHLPHQAPIEAHGGGFRLAGLSHHGSLLCLPDGVWAWPVAMPADLTDDLLAPIFARAESLDFFILGTGTAPWAVPDRLRLRFREAHIS